MSGISFKRVAADESRIHDPDGEYVGDVYAHDDVLNPGHRMYIISLDEDPRGWVRLHDRSRIREVAIERLHTHPFFQ